MTWERILGMKASEQLDWLVNHTKPLKEWLERVQACSCARGSLEVENGRPVQDVQVFPPQPFSVRVLRFETRTRAHDFHTIKAKELSIQP
jgi:hypothetical protein